MISWIRPVGAIYEILVKQNTTLTHDNRSNLDRIERRWDISPVPSTIIMVTDGSYQICSEALVAKSIHLMTSSNGTIFRVTGSLCGEFAGPGEFPAQRPVAQSVDVFFDLRLDKRLSEQPRGWWFETPPWSLWRHCNELASAGIQGR